MYQFSVRIRQFESTHPILWAPEDPESLLVGEVVERRAVDGDDPVSGLKSAVFIRRSVLVDFVDDYSSLLKRLIDI